MWGRDEVRPSLSPTTTHHLPLPTFHSPTVPKRKKLAVAAAIATLFQPLTAHSHSRQVTATVYASFFHGRPDACGGTYSDYRVSAAHPWLPCGTRVRLSHRGRVLTVPITDRCDCSSIDLSYEAARRLGVPTDGIATVTLQEL